MPKRKPPRPKAKTGPSQPRNRHENQHVARNPPAPSEGAPDKAASRRHVLSEGAPGKAPPRRHFEAGGSYWLFGHHAVAAAVANPERRVRRLLRMGADTGAPPAPATAPRHPGWEPVDRAEIERLLPPGAVHQGMAALVEPLDELILDEIIAHAEDRDPAIIVILDQVTDPHNVGAILRSAAAFGAIGVVLTERHAAPETGSLAKSASGALDLVALVRVVNLVRAMESLKQAGFWIAGLAADGERSLVEARLSGKVAIALGAEGAGLRRLTREHCDLLVRLPTPGTIDQLNVSNAAAVALYELTRR